jgi:hypothetical protein
MVIIRTSAAQVRIHAVSPLSIFAAAAAEGAAAGADSGAPITAGASCPVSCADVVIGLDSPSKTIEISKTTGQRLRCAITTNLLICAFSEQERERKKTSLSKEQPVCHLPGQKHDPKKSIFMGFRRFKAGSCCL